MIDYTFLFIGLLYATFLPGFVVTELLLPSMAFWKKLPLYLILSVLISSYFSYFASFLFGFNRETMLACFLIFFLLSGYIATKGKTNIGKGIRKDWQIILVGILIYIIFFVSLLPAIFSLYNGYFVMGGPNWQDTAMHMSIIQSLTQGNFPPQAPYFSGQPLTYYYFSDFHAAIVNMFFGKFFPEILVLLNPFLAMTFFFSVSALTLELCKKKTFSIISGIAAVFYGNFGFINMIGKLISGGTNYIALVTSNPFNFDNNFLQMTPMADYFLQNRPMMVGLPAFASVMLLILKSKNSDREYVVRILIAGTITALLIKFQLFGFVVSATFLGVYLLLQLISGKIKFWNFVRYLLIFGLPSIITGVLFAFSKVEGRSLIKIFLDTFSWGPWQGHTPIWYVYFLATNLGLGFAIFLLGIFLKKVMRGIDILASYITGLILLAIPLSMTFTIYEFDMLKFFYYLVPVICILMGVFYANIRYKKISIAVFVLITIISSVTSVNILIHSFLNKSEGYSYSDYEAGSWIISNVPENSVFVTLPTVHSAPTDIAGRLRIISYINWPYSHGFNTGTDNVFTRVKDVTDVYKSGDVALVKLKYGAGYVFYGEDERGQFPDAGEFFDGSKNLRLIYNQDGIKIYKIL